MNQLNLLTAKRCSYCQRGSLHPRNPTLWNGFQDMDTGHLVCPGCKARHYKKKMKTEKANLYSEMPVMA